MNLMRRETRRLEAADPRSLLGESYVLCPGISRLKFSFYDYKKRGVAGGVDHRGRGRAAVPAHPRPHHPRDLRRAGQEQTFTSSARIMMTERVAYRPVKS